MKSLLNVSSLEVAVGELNTQWDLVLSMSHLTYSSMSKGVNHKEQHKNLLFIYTGTLTSVDGYYSSTQFQGL